MMLAMEEVLCELTDHENNQNDQGLPPGFRFHPTDEELITFYLASKVFHATTSSTTNYNNVKFAEVDLNRCEPWELPEVAKMGEREWYLFSVRDRKYPTGLRTNRATGAGYWKATGKDKEVYSSSTGGRERGLVGMKKTLVFYKGRAPRGEKTKWVMHEYRLDGHFSPFSSHPHTHTCKEEWVICRIFHKCGEKRTSLLQGQGQGQQQQQLGASSTSPKKPTSNCLLASPTSFTSTTTLEHESQNGHISLSHLFPLQDFPNIAASNTARNHPSSDQLLFKSHHLIKQTIPKTEATFYDHYQLSQHDHANTNNNNNNLQRWMDINHSTSNNNFQNSFPLDMDYSSGLITFSGAAAAAAVANAEFRDIVSTSIPFNNRVVALDAPIGIDSWPQAQLV